MKAKKGNDRERINVSEDSFTTLRSYATTLLAGAKCSGRYSRKYSTNGQVERLEPPSFGYHSIRKCIWKVFHPALQHLEGTGRITCPNLYRPSSFGHSKIRYFYRFAHSHFTPFTSSLYDEPFCFIEVSGSFATSLP